MKSPATSGPRLDLVLSSRWTTPVNRRREGLRAAHEQDRDALCELLETWMITKSARKGQTSPATLKAYRQSVDKFLAFTGPSESPRHALNQLDEGVIEQWVTELQLSGLSSASVARALCGARALLKALQWAGVLDEDPSAQVHPPQRRSDDTRAPLSRDQLRELLAEPARRWPEEPARAARDELLLALGGVLGLRVAEVVGLTLSSVTRGEHPELIVRGKGGKVRRLPLPSQMRARLTRWLTLRAAVPRASSAPGAPLLLSLSHFNLGGALSTDGARHILGEYHTRLELPENTTGMHALRRTAGTQIYRQTRDLHVVSQILGHSSVETSAIYARMDDQIRAEALEKAESLD